MKWRKGIPKWNKRWVRKFSEMEELYEARISPHTVIYEVFTAGPFSLTKLKPGKVGKEFFMTKGHRHPDGKPELYVLLEGEAILVAEDAIWMEPGELYFVKDEPHRVINVGDKEAVFLTFSVAEHDYSVAKSLPKAREGVYLGVDMGASWIKAVLYDGDRVLEKVSRPIRDAENDLFEIIESFEFDAVGVGVPGIVDRRRGVIKVLPNLPGFENYNLRKKLSKYGVAVIENDAKCFGIAEARRQPYRNWLLLTIGTGIGGCVFIDGKMYLGTGEAGEFGAMTIDWKGAKKLSGVGCAEYYMSPKAVGILMANLAKAFAPEAIVLAGGKAKEMKDKAKRYMLSNLYFKPPKVLLAKSGYFGGALGAAILARKEYLVHQIRSALSPRKSS